MTIEPAFQQHLTFPTPKVKGNINYTELKTVLERSDEILVHSGIETAFATDYLERWVQRDPDRTLPTGESLQKLQDSIRRGLRCEIARQYLGLAFRSMSARLADSPLLQRFCRIDWILLRDGARTLMKAVNIIRKHGVMHRMVTPESFLSRMNELCIQMTHTRRHPDSKRLRKEVLRKMKHLQRVIRNHAKGYRDLLLEHWDETELSEGEAQVIVRRINSVLELLPQTVKQAHEPIIGERRVQNEDKILSLYEPDIHVIVRGKSGVEAEFGNALYLREQWNGVIILDPAGERGE